MNRDQSQQDSKKPIALLIFLVLALIAVIIAIVSLKKCAAAPVEGGEDGGGESGDSKMGASVLIEQLLDPVPEGAGPFATRIGGEGPVYFVKTDAESGKQTLTDDSGAAIYELNDDKKAWIAGFWESRVLIFYSDPDQVLTHPREAWDVNSHFSVAPESTQFGVGPIFHNEETTAAIVDSMK